MTREKLRAQWMGSAKAHRQASMQMRADGRGSDPDCWAGIRMAEVFEACATSLEALSCLPEGWQPISSAPKDGHPTILLFDGEYVTVGNWCSSGLGYWACTEAGDFSGPGWQPTHWMPIPAPPSPPIESTKTGEP